MLSGLIACLHELRHLLREKLNLRVALLQLLLQLGVGVSCPWLELSTDCHPCRNLAKRASGSTTPRCWC